MSDGADAPLATVNDGADAPLATHSAVALVGLTLFGAAAFASSSALPSVVALVLTVAFLPYAVAVSSSEPPSPRLALAVAAFAGLALAFSPSVLSDDLYRYLWDGRVLRAGLDPYALAPADPALAALRDEAWARINHPRVPTIYPPVAQGLFAALGGLAHQPLTLKLAALAAHLGTVPVVAHLAREHAGEAAGRRAASVLALNPLALSESALGGHVDVFVGLFMALFALAALRGRPASAALHAVLAAGTKLVGLVVAPLLWRRHRGAALAAALLGAVCLVPLVTAGGEGATGGLGQYARRWGGNAGAHGLLEGALRATVERTHGIGEGRVRFDGLRETVAAHRGTALDPMASFQSEKKDLGDPAELESSVVAALGARAIAAAIVFLLAIGWGLRGADPLRAARGLILAVLLLAPQIHPWYLLWLLPLEAASGRGAGLVFSAVAMVAYAPLDGWVTAREWVEPAGAAAFEHALVWAFVAHEALAARSLRRHHRIPEPPKVTPGSRVSPGARGSV